MNQNIQFDPNNLIKQGKTKNVYQGPGGNIVLEFTDRVTGNAASGEIDPGGNDQLGEQQGKSELAYKMALHYFRLLQQRNLPTHFIDACDERKLFLVRSTRMFGNGLEWIYRGVASGSFVRRYGMYVKEGAPILPYVETSLKDDERGDPFVTPQILQMLGIMPQQAYDACVQLCSNVFALVSSEMLSRGLALWDMKVELGLDAEGRIMVIDEISPDCMRVYHGKNKISGPELGAFFGF
jgi:phosphoribosylaminoimidazole-succinocarboxamide synthase